MEISSTNNKSPAAYAVGQQTHTTQAAGLTPQAHNAPSASDATSRQLGVQFAGPEQDNFVPYDATGRPAPINSTSREVKKPAYDEVKVSAPTLKGNPLVGEHDTPVFKNEQPDEEQLSLADKKEKQEEDPQVQQEIAQLRATEEKVKAHETAHKASGGAATGPISYTYTRGPDGKNYISGGEVPISVSPGRTPQETIDRMEQVVRAALAPADPSPQDRAVAAQANAQAQKARQEKLQSEPEFEDSGAEEPLAVEKKDKEQEPGHTGNPSSAGAVASKANEFDIGNSSIISDDSDFPTKIAETSDMTPQAITPAETTVVAMNDQGKAAAAHDQEERKNSFHSAKTSTSFSAVTGATPALISLYA